MKRQQSLEQFPEEDLIVAQESTRFNGRFDETQQNTKGSATTEITIRANEGNKEDRLAMVQKMNAKTQKIRKKRGVRGSSKRTGTGMSSQQRSRSNVNNLYSIVRDYHGEDAKDYVGIISETAAPKQRIETASLRASTGAIVNIGTRDQRRQRDNNNHRWTLATSTPQHETFQLGRPGAIRVDGPGLSRQARDDSYSDHSPLHSPQSLYAVHHSGRAVSHPLNTDTATTRSDQDEQGPLSLSRSSNQNTETVLLAELVPNSEEIENIVEQRLRQQVQRMERELRLSLESQDVPSLQQQQRAVGDREVIVTATNMDEEIKVNNRKRKRMYCAVSTVILLLSCLAAGALTAYLLSRRNNTSLPISTDSKNSTIQEPTANSTTLPPITVPECTFCYMEATPQIEELMNRTVLAEFITKTCDEFYNDVVSRQESDPFCEFSQALAWAHCGCSNFPPAVIKRQQETQSPSFLPTIAPTLFDSSSSNNPPPSPSEFIFPPSTSSNFSVGPSITAIVDDPLIPPAFAPVDDDDNFFVPTVSSEPTFVPTTRMPASPAQPIRVPTLRRPTRVPLPQPPPITPAPLPQSIPPPPLRTIAPGFSTPLLPQQPATRPAGSLPPFATPQLPIPDQNFGTVVVAPVSPFDTIEPTETPIPSAAFEFFPVEFEFATPAPTFSCFTPNGFPAGSRTCLHYCGTGKHQITLCLPNEEQQVGNDAFSGVVVEETTTMTTKSSSDVFGNVLGSISPLSSAPDKVCSCNIVGCGTCEEGCC